ncbi:DDE superfamily endonuclease [Nitzschia inconspicua]|uniref:DDE superfamily endonuclease n=1 Tax=Nitzschia inconspicua TaxID=303405 RepID=A0A9K3KQA2_9STRA|nr:DDE superfamily endonuclease [Nitzschia inconspicua]
MLAEGLCLFGDNAYLNSPFLAIPYQNVGPGTKDDYNFYHSQLRIRVECAFGIFTERWAILRSAIPKQITIAKTIALVHALAKPQDVDHMTRNLTGSVPLEADEIEDTPRPIQLIGAGHHFDDVPREIRRRRQVTPCQPRELLHERISNEHWKRPSRKVISRGRP